MQSLIYSNTYFDCRSLGALCYARSNGDAAAAQQEFGQVCAHRLAPNQSLPSLNFFSRNAEKLLEHHTVENLVSYATTFYVLDTV